MAEPTTTPPASKPSISLQEASDAMRKAMQEAVAKNAWLFILQAVLMILAGVLMLVYPLLSTVALALALGWVLVVSGIIQILSLFGASKVPHFWMQLISAGLAAIVGYLFIRNPGIGIETLLLLLIVFFIVGGMAKIVFSLTVRPLPNWGWVLASGILGVVIGFYLLYDPVLSLIVLVLLVAIQLISEGAAIGWMAWQARKARP